MKKIVIVFVICCLSCAQNTKDKTSTNKANTNHAVKVVDAPIEAAAERIEEAATVNTTDFKNAIKSLQVKTLPQVDTTNFDSFIDEDDFHNLPVKTLQLEKIYPDFRKNSYKTIRGYRVNLDTNRFYSLAITVQKSAYEMETVLVNYSLSGHIIDHKIIAYDEIADGSSRIESRINQSFVTVHRIFYGNETQIEQIKYRITADGTFKKKDTKQLQTAIDNYLWIEKVINQLPLTFIQLHTNLIRSKPLPDTDETVIVFPEIVEEGEGYFSLNSHIILANSQTGKVTHTYFESAKTNGWYSDAVMLKEISIDTAPYDVAETIRAFGVRVNHYGMSRVNPYTSETLSLFIKADNKLKNILPNYEVKNYGGEWDGSCEGEFIDENKVLLISEEKTNDYFDIVVKNKMTKMKQTVDEHGECDTKETSTTLTSVLKFDGQRYK